METAQGAGAAKMEQSLSRMVYNELLNRIFNRSWLPGTFYDRRKIAREFGVSISPVNEALVRLEKDGFVANLPRRGTMLRPSDPRRLYESLILREAIECQAISMVYGKKTELIGILRDFLKERAISGGGDCRDTDNLFHRKLVEMSGVEIMLANFDNLQLQVLFEEIRNVPPVNHEDTIQIHLRLLDSISQTKTPDEAAVIIRQHIRLNRWEIYERFS